MDTFLSDNISENDPISKSNLKTKHIKKVDEKHKDAIIIRNFVLVPNLFKGF